MAKAKATKTATKTKTKKAAALPRTYVTFLLDRSGSMASIKSQTIEGFNTYLAGLQAQKDADIRFTFLTFDSHSLDKIYVGAPVAEVAFLTDKTFVPRGGTPLVASSYSTIKAVEEAIARDVIAHKRAMPKVVVCIQTDGEETDAHHYGYAGPTWEELSELVKGKQEAGWQFNFLGAGIDAYKQAAKMSIGAGATMSYGTGMAHTRAAFAASASNSANYASGAMANTQYMQSQKLASGDAFDPLDLGKLRQNQAVPRGVSGRSK